MERAVNAALNAVWVLAPERENGAGGEHYVTLYHDVSSGIWRLARWLRSGFA